MKGFPLNGSVINAIALSDERVLRFETLNLIRKSAAAIHPTVCCHI
jgi:hypothetical protein